ncbi:hypothetical protein IOC57_10975 [Bacillus sp. SD075]|uniref:hypothetical protein n=1 Tax=Bacillus sp. SD075 TaxID=2781732 RepID=UPI001A964825|nr:hypothetical protein [Bacillus sp. SD075]MBO0998264.1 hypothetical protein [Bacillus sp. SD075]
MTMAAFSLRSGKTIVGLAIVDRNAEQLARWKHCPFHLTYIKQGERELCRIGQTPS